MMKKTWKIIIRVLLCIIFILLCAYNITYINTTDIRLREETIKSSKVDANIDGLTIIYFSDLHYDTYTNSVDLSLIKEKIDNVNPDIIIFGGDLIDKAINGNTQSELTNFLRDLNGKYGKYAVLGDKDHELLEQTTSILNEGDFRILTNTNQRIYINGSFIELVGIDSYIKGSPDVTSAYEGTNATYYTFAISHCPDIFDSLDLSKTDYVLSGHSLGGQVYIPLINLFYRPSGAMNYYHGKYKTNGVTLDISNGIGTIENDIRMLADAEIVVYKLKSN